MPTLSEIEPTKETKLNNFTISIKDCVALCKIINGFDEFVKNLKEFSKGKKAYSNLNNLYKYILEGKKVKKDIRHFYVQNHKILDTIHKNTYISNFLLIYFDRNKGKYNQEITEMFEYIKNNRGNIDKILENLEKLKTLGFEYIYFAENKKFDSEYEYDQFSQYYYFVDGKIEIIPSIGGYNYASACINSFEYKTTGANYEIEFSRFPFHNTKITLNNLVFDSNLLPQNLSYDNTIKKIIDLRKEKEESYLALNNTIVLDDNLSKMNIAIEKIDEIIIGIQNCKYKERVKKNIINAKRAINDLKSCLIYYESDLVEEGLLEREILEEEKKKYK